MRDLRALAIACASRDDIDPMTLFKQFEAELQWEGNGCASREPMPATPLSQEDFERMKKGRA